MGRSFNINELSCSARKVRPIKINGLRNPSNAVRPPAAQHRQQLHAGSPHVLGVVAGQLRLLAAEDARQQLTSEERQLVQGWLDGK